MTSNADLILKASSSAHTTESDSTIERVYYTFLDITVSVVLPVAATENQREQVARFV